MIRYIRNHVLGEFKQWCSEIRYTYELDEKMENKTMENLINGR